MPVNNTGRTLGDRPGPRVLQVVAYLSATGAYGGPSAVAHDQCAALSRDAHHAELLAGWDCVATKAAPFPVHAFPAYRLTRRSFASLIAPRAIAWFLRHGRRFEVIHVHLARDLLTLPIAALAVVMRIPLVVQTHGMIRPDSRPLVRLLDAAITRPLMRRTALALVLTAQEHEDLLSLGVPAQRLRTLENAAPASSFRARHKPLEPTLLFVSRLAERKRPTAFVQAAAHIHGLRPDVRFELWGPDEGELDAVRRMIDELGLQDTCSYKGSVPRERIAQLLSGGQALILPSFQEPFPMVVLEALSVGLPTVLTHDTGLSAAVANEEAGLVTDGSPRAMGDAALTLLESAGIWGRHSDAALHLATERFSRATLVTTLTSTYDEAAS